MFLFEINKKGSAFQIAHSRSAHQSERHFNRSKSFFFMMQQDKQINLGEWMHHPLQDPLNLYMILRFFSNLETRVTVLKVPWQTLVH